MLGRSFLTAGCVMVWVAIWAGCGGESKSIPSGASDSGTDDDPTNVADGSDKVKPKDAGATKKDASTPDDGKLPPSVEITYGQCADFEACGGDIVGTWTVSGGCVSDQSFADLKKGDCVDAQESDVVIKAAGVVTATATTLTRNIKVDISAKVAVPPKCAAQGGGDCSLVAYGISHDITGNGAPFDKATCTDDGAQGCNCTVSKAIVQHDTVNYTIDGNSIATDGDPPESLDYCVDGDKLTYQQGAVQTSVPFTVELTKK